jgi:hypothetical protein
MQLDTAITEVQQIVGWRSDKIPEITRALAYSQTERDKPGKTYPCWLRTTATITTVAGQQNYLLPTNYIQDTEERDGNIYLYTGAPFVSRVVFLKKMSFEIAQEAFFGRWPGSSGSLIDQSATVQNGVPTAYVLREADIYLYPTPNAVYNFAWKYWGKAAAQTLGQENAWLREAPWVLIGEAAKKIASDLGYVEGAAVASAILETAEQNMFRAVIHREEAGRRRSMGSRL